MGSPFLNQVKADDRLPSSQPFVQVRFTESPSLVVLVPFGFVTEMFKSRGAKSCFSFKLYRLNCREDSQLCLRYEKENLPTTFNVEPALPVHLPSSELIINLKMCFPVSLCSTVFIFKEQLSCLSPIY